MSREEGSILKKITLKAVRESIPRITAFVDNELEQLGCSMKAQMQIDIAIDEIVANVSFYAYAPGTGNVEVGFDYNPQDETAVITFTYSGVAFNPLEKEEPDTGLTAEEREIGGLGIFLVRKTMDGMEYRRENGQNILTVRKKIK